MAKKPSKKPSDLRRIEISLVALYRADKYILALRQGDKSRGAVGLTGFFGGSREPGESWEQAARRELREETNLELKDSDLTILGFVEVESDRDNQRVMIKAAVCRVQLDDNATVIATDPRDTVVTLDTSEIIDGYLGKNRLTPATEAAFNTYILEGRA